MIVVTASNSLASDSHPSRSPGASVSRAQVFEVLDRSQHDLVEQGDFKGGDRLARSIQDLRRFKGENLDRIRYHAQLAVESTKWPVDEGSVSEGVVWTIIGTLVCSPILGGIFGGGMLGEFLASDAAFFTTCGLVIAVPPLATKWIGARRLKHRQQARESLKLLEDYRSKFLAGTSVPSNETEARFQASRLREEAVAKARTALSGMEGLMTTTGTANQLAQEALEGLGRCAELAPAVELTAVMTRDLDPASQLKGRREAVASLVRSTAPQDAPGLARLAMRIHEESAGSLADGLVLIARASGNPIARALLECQHTHLKLRMAILGADRPDTISHLTLAD
ncbi:MAG: hypothetical protein AB1758_11725, partial [Candidatus Eremiobacterota bacterium]